MVHQDSTTPSTDKTYWDILACRTKIQAFASVLLCTMIILGGFLWHQVGPNQFIYKKPLNSSFRQNILSHHHHTHADQPWTTPLLHHEKRLKYFSRIVISCIIKADKLWTVSYTFTLSPKSPNRNNLHFIKNADAKIISGQFVDIQWVQAQDKY